MGNERTDPDDGDLIGAIALARLRAEKWAAAQNRTAPHFLASDVGYLGNDQAIIAMIQRAYWLGRDEAKNG